LQNQTISIAYDTIEELTEEILPLKRQAIALEAEIGPLKYIAELIYGDEAADYFDTAVRWIIILLVVVFDPLAICLLLAGNTGIMQKKRVTFMTEEEILKDIEIDEPLKRWFADGTGRDGN